MAQLLSGKKALVTGGTKGIGLEVARSLLSEGADVVICGRNPKGVEAALSSLRASTQHRKVSGQVADVSNSGAVRELFRHADRELNGLNILINNAGSGVFRPAADISIEEWDRVIG